MNRINKKEILKKRLKKAESHYVALRDYKALIDKMQNSMSVFESHVYVDLMTEQKAVLDAYLKRFSSIQDFLGAKVFPLMLDVAGLSITKMSEVLSEVEREGIIDSISNWIELRDVKNELEHDYPDELEDALEDLKFCVECFYKIESYYKNSVDFAMRYVK